MKAFMGILFLILAAPSLAQAPSPDSISLGDFGPSVRLTLGMPKEAALRSLRESYGVTDLESGGVSVHSKSNPDLRNLDLVYGSVSFKEGRLSSVTKYWNINGPDRGVAVVRAIYGAMSSFGGSTRACSVETFDSQEPIMEKRGVAVSCGRRRVAIFTNRWAFSSGASGESVVLNEVLSSEP